MAAVLIFETPLPELRFGFASLDSDTLIPGKVAEPE
jgi:hypothetical protein